MCKLYRFEEFDKFCHSLLSCVLHKFKLECSGVFFFFSILSNVSSWVFLSGSLVKNLSVNTGDMGQSLGQEVPWRRKWQLTPIFLPDKPHGQRSLADYSPGGHKESDTTEQLTLLLLTKYIKILCF